MFDRCDVNTGVHPGRLGMCWETALTQGHRACPGRLLVSRETGHVLGDCWCPGLVGRVPAALGLANGGMLFLHCGIVVICYHCITVLLPRKQS